MLVYRLCISVLLTCELHLIGLSQINTRWSVTSLVGLLKHCLRDYVNVFSMIYLLPVVFMLLVQVQVIDWKDQLLRNDLVLQFVDDDVKPDSLTSPTVQSLYYCEISGGSRNSLRGGAKPSPPLPSPHPPLLPFPPFPSPPLRSMPS